MSEKTAKPKKAAKATAEATVTSESSRGRRKVRIGQVVSNKMTKTVVVRSERRTQHPLYGKVVIRSERFKAHDEFGCDVGDTVEIIETRPMSKEKRWRVSKIVEKVK